MCLWHGRFSYLSMRGGVFFGVVGVVCLVVLWCYKILVILFY